MNSTYSLYAAAPLPFLSLLAFCNFMIPSGLTGTS